MFLLFKFVTLYFLFIYWIIKNINLIVIDFIIKYKYLNKMVYKIRNTGFNIFAAATNPRVHGK